ncbi:MAG TPA: hypothetical protein VIE43_06235 [Thermoanaerobaculia bacterium]|jgi:hypothetical protein|nr:hypothetical protein [Thermoanaerobaculia bacterium]
MTTDSLRRPVSPATPAYAAPAAVDRLQTTGLVAGAIGLLLCALGWFVAPDYFFRGYLVGWVFWVGVSLGCMAICMVGHLSGGDWAVVSRRILEAASRVLPAMAILFVPLLFGLTRLYAWAHPELIQTDHVVAMKAPWFYLLSLSTTAPLFFYIRQVLYFAIWIGLAYRLSSLSLRQDRTADTSLLGKMRVVSAPGLILYCLSITFASVDWLMSLQIHWFSTIFGFYLIASEALAAFAFLIVIAVFLSRSEPMAGVFQPRHFHDWGKFLFAFVMIWTYFSWSQFLITWAGNLPTEIAFFLPRINGGFGWVALAIVVFHFTVPFALLLSRDLKRNGKTLAMVALGLLFMRLVELFWQVEPAFPAAARHAAFDWQYLAAPLFIGGLWLFFFARTLKSRPLLPINDPYLPEAIAHGHSHH